MSISVDTILSDWKKNQFKPVYWLEGEEGFYIDLLIHYAEHEILTEQEASFNLTVFYGKDAVWSEIMNACRKYPMFADKQIVILKEAQQMRDIEKLETPVDGLGRGQHDFFDLVGRELVDGRAHEDFRLCLGFRLRKLKAKDSPTRRKLAQRPTK